MYYALRFELRNAASEILFFKHFYNLHENEFVKFFSKDKKCVLQSTFQLYHR